MNKTLTFIVVFLVSFGTLHNGLAERYVSLFYYIFPLTIFYFIWIYLSIIISIIIHRNTIIHTKKNRLCMKNLIDEEF